VTSARSHHLVERLNMPGLAVVVLAALGAELAVRRFGLEDSVAAPSDALSTLLSELRTGSLRDEIGATLSAYLQGLGVAIVVGVAVGVAIGSSRTLLDSTSVVIEFLRPIPAVALIPLATAVFGLDTEMRRFLVAYAAVWPILFNTMYGVRGVDGILYDVARTSGVTRLGILPRVTLPAAMPSIVTGIRISASLALLVCVTAEFVTQTAGVGAYMARQYGAIQIEEMYAAILLTAVLGYGVNLVLRTTERRVLFWVGEDRSPSQ
jgi:NitT/TauT family transport system permease protein